MVVIMLSSYLDLNIHDVKLSGCHHDQFTLSVREAIEEEKNGLTMDFFRKGGGGLAPIHNFGAHFCASGVKVFFV